MVPTSTEGETQGGPVMWLRGECWSRGAGGLERSVREENLLGLMRDMADCPASTALPGTLWVLPM